MLTLIDQLDTLRVAGTLRAVETVRAEGNVRTIGTVRAVGTLKIVLVRLRRKTRYGCAKQFFEQRTRIRCLHF